jgi:hypothetical protein
VGFGGENWERDDLEDVDIDRRVVLKVVFEKDNGEAWNGLVYLRMAIRGGLL